ncbi:MAG: hypothetical protein PHG82_05085 [Candidatus Gracilibacteria bacterium]|nr:hypothetical protein [Candidatus Gracilibacteria bacterium]
MNKESNLGYEEELNENSNISNQANTANKLQLDVLKDFNEILDADIKIQKIAQSIAIMKENGDYYAGYKIIKEAIEYEKNLKDFHKAFLYENLGDFLWELGDYYKTLDSYNESKKYGNRLVYEKILNLYTSELLVDEGENFSAENNTEFLLGECKNACEYNKEAYGDYGYYTYKYKKDLETAEKILNEGIEKGSDNSLAKYIELHRDIFLLDLGKIENKQEKKEFIDENKQKIEKLYKEAIDLGKTIFIGELGSFYEEIGFYHNAIELYELHIEVNKDYTYYKNLGDIFSSDIRLLYTLVDRNKNLISSYLNLSDLAYMHNDDNNYIYGLKNLFIFYIKIADEDNLIETSGKIIKYAQKNKDIDLEEEILLELYKFNNLNYSEKISDFNITLKESKYDFAFQMKISTEIEDLNYSYGKIQRKILDNLVDIDNKYLLLEGEFYEGKNNRTAFNSYLKAYLISLFDDSEDSLYGSGDALGMFLYSLSLSENVSENKFFLEDMAKKAYNYDELLDNETKTIKELIKS